MRQELLYAFAAAGVLAVGRLFVLFALRCLAGTSRVRRFVFRQVVETITNPEWQDHVAAETRKFFEEFGAVDQVRGRPAPPPPLRLRQPRA